MMKYAATILTALALVGSGWAIVAVSRPMSANFYAPDTSSTITDQIKSSEAELLHLRGLEKTLEQINRLTLASQPPVPILSVHSDQPKNDAAGKDKAPTAPDVSLVYISSDLQKVMINGKLLGVGDVLPGGGKLISISQDHVIFKRHGRQVALPLPRPNVLGMESNAGKER